MNTNEEIRAAIEAAFKPLRCVAEIWDFGQKLSFRVFDAKDHTVLTVPNEVLESLRDVPGLEALIQDARSRIAANGHHLDPWLN
jgi:hypothetical protein